MRRLTGLATLLWCLTAAAQNVGEPRLFVLDNGLRVITVENHDAPLVSAVWSAHVGDSAEPADFAGNSHFLEHLLLFRGTEKYPENQIGEWASGRGGYFNGSTSYDFTAFVLSMASSDLDGILDRHEQMMFHGSFSGQDFETEKRAVFEELRSGQDTPYGYIWRSGSYHMYPEETFYSRSTIGTIETVQAATLDAIRKYYRDYYVPNNMTLAVVGDFDTDELLAKIEQRFAAYPRGPVPDSAYAPLAMKPGINVVAEERALGKAYFLMAVEGPTATSPEYFPYLLLAEYLAGGKTSVLFSELVTELELLDDVDMAAWPRRYPKGWQGFSGETESGEAVSAIDALWKILARVRASGAPEDELEFARQRLMKRHWQRLDDINEVAEALAREDARGDYRLFSDFDKRLAAVTAADVQAVARKYLTPGHFFVFAVFPPGELPPDFSAQIQANAARLGGDMASMVSKPLPSGATLLYESRPGASMESYTVAVRAGERHGKDAGIAAAVANMLVRETGNFSKTGLQNKLDQDGLTLRASASLDATYVSLQAPSGNSAKAMSMLMEVLTNPAFSASEWADVRAEMQAEFEQSLDQPRAVAGDLLVATVFSGTEYGRSTADKLAALSRLSAGDLRSFWKRHFKAEALAVAYTGASSAAAIEAGLAPLGTLSGKPPAEATIHVADISEMRSASQAMAGKTQTNLFISWHAPDIGSEDWIYYQLAQKAIGGDLAGRLWKLRQQEGLAYAVGMFGLDVSEQPITAMYMATAGEKRDSAIAALHREIGRLQTGLSEDELERVKVSYLAQLNRVDRTAAQRSARHARWWVSGFNANRREKLTEVIGKATLTDVNRVIREVIDPENYVYVEAGVVGD